MNSYLNNEPWFYAFQLYFSQSYCFMFIEREENYFFLSGVSYVRFGRVFILAAFPDQTKAICISQDQRNAKTTTLCCQVYVFNNVILS